jgi:dTDP-4-amino-4,6-dideoxygalactose transaminase
MDKPYPVGRPNIGEIPRFMERVQHILESRWFSNNGELVKEFEQRVAHMLGVPHAVAMCNATVALSLVAHALKLQGEVIVPSYTAAATPHSMSMAGLKPIFADVNPDTHNIDPLAVARLVTERTSAIVGVHLWGRPCDVASLQEVADRAGVPLVLDAAHAFGVSHGGRMLGGFGRCEVFSFHATKFVNSFEGGMVVTHDDELAERLRLMRNFGFAAEDKVIYLGTNAKMSEISAAMGLTNLEAVSEFVEVNRRNHTHLCQALEGCGGLRVVQFNPEERNNWQYLVVELDSDLPANLRDTLVDNLKEQGYLARRYFWPGCHNMAPYANDPSHVPEPLLTTTRIAERVLVLPNGQLVGERQIDQMAQIIRQGMKQLA